MRILWLNAGLLLPLDKGGKLRTWHLMRHLARRHEITYASFRDPNEPRPQLDGMLEVCARLETVPRRDTVKRSLRFYAHAARYLIDSQPYAVAKYRSPEYAEMVSSLLASGRFDVLVCDFLPPLVNLPRRLPCPAVLFTHNVEAEIWRRHADVAGGLSRALLRTQWRRMDRFEREAMKRFGLVLAVSDADRETLERLYSPAAPVVVVPTGVDTRFFTPAAAPTARGRLVFTGSMDWLPNEDGVVWFCRDVLPAIRREEPDATLTIVGRAPTPAVRRLSETPGVEVTGRVEDVRAHIAAASVYVVPLRIGGGTRLKIFEAMSMGKATVTTAIGAEGLPVTPGEHLLVAADNDAMAFASAVVRLLRDAGLRRRMGDSARQLVVERYDWETAATALDVALRHAARGHARAYGDSTVSAPAAGGMQLQTDRGRT
jgi:sugar transferase (PEP-CTERM/EpsH1 system associated)